MKTKIIVVLVALGLGVLIGYKLAYKPDEAKKEVKDKNKEVIRIVERPGEKITEIIRESEHKASESVTKNKPKNTVSALLAAPLSHYEKPIYGVQYTREFMGPVSVGGFYLSNETIGVSIGISF